MTTKQEKPTKLISWMITSLDLSWIQAIVEAWKLVSKILRGLANEGMFEVLAYESTLELLDNRGKRATFQKRKKVRYLQDNIIAYPDYAWGDGEILLNYKCSPGNPVDRYRSGFKTYVLLSLREVKNRGDEDEFNIQWGIRNGFLTPDGFWGTDISNRTRHIITNVIFPKSRPPQRTILIEENSGKTHKLGSGHKRQLPDGRWIVSWGKRKPRLYEHYLLKWWW